MAPLPSPQWNNLYARNMGSWTEFGHRGELTASRSPECESSSYMCRLFSARVFRPVLAPRCNVNSGIVCTHLRNISLTTYCEYWTLWVAFTLADQSLGLVSWTTFESLFCLCRETIGTGNKSPLTRSSSANSYNHYWECKLLRY